MPRRKALEEAGELAPSLARRPDAPARREDDLGQTWDERNRAAAFRIRAEDHERLAGQAQELGLSKDALGAALLWAALDALSAGWLTLETETVETSVTDKAGRQRFYIRKQARPAWQIPGISAQNRS